MLPCTCLLGFIFLNILRHSLVSVPFSPPCLETKSCEGDSRAKHKQFCAVFACWVVCLAARMLLPTWTANLSTHQADLYSTDSFLNQWVPAEDCVFGNAATIPYLKWLF